MSWSAWQSAGNVCRSALTLFFAVKLALKIGGNFWGLSFCWQRPWPAGDLIILLPLRPLISSFDYLAFWNYGSVFQVDFGNVAFGWRVTLIIFRGSSSGRGLVRSLLESQLDWGF